MTAGAKLMENHIIEKGSFGFAAKRRGLARHFLTILETSLKA
jgi:hypothetical protein